MATYAIWNNKGGVGKSYLTFQLACEYAALRPHETVLAVDLCPQANSSGMLLGGIEAGEEELESLSGQSPPRTISGYVEDRIRSPYVNTRTGSSYAVRVADFNDAAPWKDNPNVFHTHPNGSPPPGSRRDFERMFQAEVPDANTASVVSSSLGIPVVKLSAGMRRVAGKDVMVNQSQLDRQQPGIRALAELIT